MRRGFWIFVPIQRSIQRDFFSAHALGQNGKISILSIQPRERVCGLLVLNSVTSTPQWIHQPKPRDVVHDVRVCLRVHVCSEVLGLFSP
jgi:hypothetical protein